MNCEDVVPSPDHFKKVKKELIASTKRLVHLMEKSQAEFGEFVLGDDEFLKHMKEALIIFKSLEYKDE